MYLVAIAWMYVVLMAALVEAFSTDGTVVGAIATFVFFGLLPLGIVMYLLGTPSRRRAGQAQQRNEVTEPLETPPTPATDAATNAGSVPRFDPDRSGHPSGDPVAPERKEP